jgi:hypothetical protein
VEVWGLASRKTTSQSQSADLLERCRPAQFFHNAAFQEFLQNVVFAWRTFPFLGVTCARFWPTLAFLPAFGFSLVAWAVVSSVIVVM